MSNARYTLNVDTNDDNLMFSWRTHLNHNLPFNKLAPRVCRDLLSPFPLLLRCTRVDRSQIPS